MKPAIKPTPDPLTVAVEELGACLRLVAHALRQLAPGGLADDLERAIDRRLRALVS